jgi:hypothetical protein
MNAPLTSLISEYWIQTVCRSRALDPLEVEGLEAVGGLSYLPRPLVAKSRKPVEPNDQV